MPLTNEYCAGFFDGEGTATAQRLPITGNRHFDYYRVTASIGNTNLAVLQALQKVWRGTISAGKPASPKHKQQYTWKLSTQQVVPFLTSILPHLIVKAAVVKKVLELQALFRRDRRKVPLAEEQQRFALFLEIRSLNKRGSGRLDVGQFPLPREFVPVIANRQRTITHKMVAEIRRRYVRGEPTIKIARSLNISRDSVTLIGRGKHRITHPKDRESLTLLETPRQPASWRSSHCKRGHKFTEANTGTSKTGWRWCRKCMHQRYLVKIGKLAHMEAYDAK